MYYLKWFSAYQVVIGFVCVSPPLPRCCLVCEFRLRVPQVSCVLSRGVSSSSVSSSDSVSSCTARVSDAMSKCISLVVGPLIGFFCLFLAF